MGMRLQNKCLLVAMFCAAFCAACSLDRSGLGCREGFMSDETGQCQAFDASFDASFDAGPLDAGSEPDADLMVDAGPDIGPIDDAGPDAWIEPDGGPPDGGPPDGGPPDGGPPDSGPIDAGPPSPLLRIRYVSGTGPIGIAYRVAWTELPPIGSRTTDWFYDTCWGRTTPLAVGEECLAYSPEMARSGARVDMFPYDASGGMAGCTLATCPPLCTATTCPGTYTFEYAPNPPASGVLRVGLETFAFYSYML